MGKYRVLEKYGSAYAIKTTKDGKFSEELFKSMGHDTLAALYKLLVQKIAEINKGDNQFDDVNVSIKITARGTTSKQDGGDDIPS